MLVLAAKEVVEHREKMLKLQIEGFRKKYKKAPGLAVVLVGDDPASQIYVRNKEKACNRVGIISTRFDIQKKGNQEELEALITRLNADRDVHGILVQTPLPDPFKMERVLMDLDPLKDVDGLSYTNRGIFWAGQARVIPCTPLGILLMLEHYKLSVRGMRAVVIGRSGIVGKPMAQLLMDQDATVTVCHSKTQNISSYSKEADVVVVAAGKPRLFGKDDFKKGAIVVDVGIHRNKEGKLCGDVRFEELENWAKAATPVPGGVGPMTIQGLLENTLKLAELQESGRHQ